MADLRLVLEWLKGHIPHEYLDPPRVYAEVAGTLQSNPLLHPRTSVFVHEDGRSELLLCIDGLLPIHYRNNNYKIPVAIWIPQDYPHSPPMVFVTPRKDMIVKQSRNVDPNGKCYHPNLANWSVDPNSASHRTSNLLAIIQVFQRLFSENPPVRSVTPQPPQRQQAPPPPLPPRPTGSTSPPNHPASPILPPPVSPSRAPPPPPPRPPSLLSQPQLHVDTVNGVSRSSSSSSLDQLSRSPPYHRKSPPPLPPNPPPLPPHHFRNNTPPPVNAYRPSLPQSPYQQQFNRPRATSLTQQLSPTAAPAPDILDTSLPPIQSSVLPPPPLPPNPEHARLVKHLSHLIQGYIQPSIQSTREKQTEARSEREKLLNVEVQVEKEVAELTRLKDSCDRNIIALKECIHNSQGVIEWARNRGEVSGDEIVCAQTLVYDQLFNLVAEDLAIEETMEVLAKALDYERITLDVFLKETRKLAREQFLIKALIQKIVKAAGVEDGYVNGGPVVAGGGMTPAEYYYSYPVDSK